MDLSREYVLMCEGAGELQGGRRLKPRKTGDFMAGDNNSLFVITHGILARDDKEPYRFEVSNITGKAEKDCWQGNGQVISSLSLQNYAWLPRMDQLLELLQENEPTLSIADLLYEVSMEMRKVWTRFPTAEQQMLNMVMQRLYQKDWNGSEWTDHFED